MRRVLMTAVAVALLGASAAQAAPSRTFVLSGNRRALAEIALAHRDRVPTPAGSIDLRLGACPLSQTASGCVPRDQTTDAWVVYVDAGEMRGRVVQGTFLHELGHVYDSTSLTDEQRAAFTLRDLGLTPEQQPWRNQTNIVGGDPDARAPEEERFAEFYRLCALYPTYRAMVHAGSYWSSYGVAGSGTYPSRARWTRTCGFIRSLPVGAR